jgi:hypothetical protein
VDMLPRHVGGRYPTPGHWWLGTELNRIHWLSDQHSAVEFPSQTWWTVRDSNSHFTVAGRG